MNCKLWWKRCCTPFHTFKIVDEKSLKTLKLNRFHKFSFGVDYWTSSKKYDEWIWGNKDKTILKNLRFDRTDTFVLKPVGM